MQPDNHHVPHSDNMTPMATDNPENTKQTSDALLVQVFRSAREEGLYLYVEKQEGMARVPDALLARFGKPESALLLMLTPERKLSRALASNVLSAIESQGFYLQMPPEQDTEMLRLRLNNPKL